MDDLKYWVALNHFPKFGPVRYKKIRKHFANLEAAFNSSAKELVEAGIENKIAEEFIITRSTIVPDKIIEKLNSEKINVLTIENPLYPKLLLQIYDPPQLLYYKGELDPQNEFTVAVVGSRKYSSYGKQTTQQIVSDLVKNNLTIASGLALGIDTLAHLTALEARGRTMAVLGSGLDKQNIYPWQNRYLADKIINSGGIIFSEFAPGTPPLKHHFPQRNRLISGLALAILIIEAGEKSGSLITANHALEQNREVFAIPGNIYSAYSVGTNQLIKLGAKVVTQAIDIIEALNLAQVSSYIENKKIIPESKEEEKILSVLSSEPLYIDELVHLTQLDTAKVNSTLVVMEMKGMVKNLGGMQYVLAR